MDATAENATRTTAGFYCYMVVPPIQRILDILLDTLFVGGCRPPLIRELAEQADVARGAVTDLLRQLATDGWISYDGRTITLLRDGSEVDDLIDQVIDQNLRRSWKQRFSAAVRRRPLIVILIDHVIDQTLPPDPPWYMLIINNKLLLLLAIRGGCGGATTPRQPRTCWPNWGPIRKLSRVRCASAPI